MSIPVMQIFRESFSHFKEHKISWLKLAFAPIVLYVLGFFLVAFIAVITGAPIHPHRMPTGFWHFFGSSANFILSMIAFFSLYVNGYRYGILNEGGDSWWLLQLNKRLIRLFLYTLLVGLIMIGFALLGFGVVFLSHLMFMSLFLNVVVGILVALAGFYIMIRLALVYPLIAIDRENPISTSWAMMKGNVLHLFGLVLIIGLKIFLILLAGMIIIGAFGALLYFISPFLLFIPGIIGTAFIVYIWLLNWAVMAKAISLVYLSFTKGKV